MHARARQARQSALHEFTTGLVRKFDLICIEDLSVKGLARGRQARAIQDVALGELRRQLNYKADWYGRVLVKVDRWYPSSKRCSGCQHTRDGCGWIKDSGPVRNAAPTTTVISMPHGIC